jgi:hypothetical protein
MGTAVRTAKTSPASWDAFADVDAFVDEVLAELAATETDGTKPTRSGPKPALAGAAPCQVDHGCQGAGNFGPSAFPVHNL